MSNRTSSRMGPAERRVFREVNGSRRRFEQALRSSPQKAETSFLRGPSNPPVPLNVAAHLAMARLVDAHPQIVAELRAGGTVLIEVADAALFAEARTVWRDVLELRAGQVLYLDMAGPGDFRPDYAALAMVAAEPLRPRDRVSTVGEILPYLAWGLPTVGLATSVKSCMPAALQAAARHTLVLPPLDATVVARTIRLVTGQPCPSGALRAVKFPIAAEHAGLSIRHGRSPAACIAEIARLQSAKGEDKSRTIALDDLHGLDPAVAWAQGTLADLAAWRHGEIGWDQVDHACLVVGPPGCGKTLFAQAFADAAGLPLVSASLARWQAAGHLGDLLKAMRRDFDRARSLAPCVIFTDEVDSFGDRQKIRHDHADYVRQVINAYLECLDGIDGRSGLIFLAAANDIGSCDPAILRSGRLNRVIRIGLPDATARIRMIRVRLGSDLPETDLTEVAAFADGMSGADIEKLVKDARRIARQAGRPLAEADLMAALSTDLRARSPAMRQRVAVHEAGHGLVAVLVRGPEGISITTRGQGDDLGSISVRMRDLAGTAGELEDELAILLAGRAAEKVLLGAPCAGAGGMPGSDLQLATQLAASMVGSLGLAGPHPELYVAAARQTADILAQPALRLAAVEI